jgi:polyvinyl alcohol dehydrogenase (cytochrome)
MKLAVLFVLAAAAAHASDWPKYHGNVEMTGVASAAGPLSTATAPFLRPKWITRLRGPIAAEPTVANGRVYIGDWSGHEWAVSIDSGIVLAQADLGTTTLAQCEPSTIGITSAAAAAGDAIYVAGGDDGFYCLDAETLEVRWRRSLGDNGAGYYGWCSPSVADGRVIQGISSNCDTPFVPGRVITLDLLNGETMDDTYLIAPQWPHDDDGAGVWTSPAVDVESQKVFVTTGSASEMQDGHSYSMVRLSLGDLRIEEAWKIVDEGIEDADWGSSPTLFTDAAGNRLVGAGQKDGHYYAFRRNDLAAGPVWKTTLAFGGPCPPCGDGTLSTAAFDGTRLYVGAGRPLAAP